MKDNPKAIAGRAKPQTHDMPFGAILDLGQVFKSGAQKYGHKNWRDTKIVLTDYQDAMFRHFTEFFEECVDHDKDSGLSPLLHIAATCLVAYDAMKHDSFVDDRKKPSKSKGRK